MRVFFIGDIFGRPGRDAVRDRLPQIMEEQGVDLCVANAENCAGGNGLTPSLAEELLSLQIDVLTSGNHIWDKKEILTHFERQPRLLRPANYPPSAPGKGTYIGRTRGGIPFAVINLQGRVFMPSIDCPFRMGDEFLDVLNPEINVVLVDFHAEATAEKQALGWYFDGRVSAIVGTHTHVATADESVLPQGTAYITDVGMTGPHHSVIGVKKEMISAKFIAHIPVRFETASEDVRINGVLIDINEQTGKALGIERFRLDISS